MKTFFTMFLIGSLIVMVSWKLSFRAGFREGVVAGGDIAYQNEVMDSYNKGKEACEAAYGYAPPGWDTPEAK